MRGLLASPLALLIGLSLGALGGGGSILAIPALVYGAGQDARAATGTSLLIVGLSALLSMGDHARRGNVRWTAGIVFGLAGIGGNVVGTHLNRSVDPDLLLLVFSGVMVLAGLAMLRRTRRVRTSGEADLAAGVSPAPAATVSRAPAPNGGLATMVEERPLVEEAAFGLAVVGRVLVAGSIVGALTGFFGVGGGFVIVPALVLSLGFAMPQAVGTSLIVIAINAATALALRAGQTSIDWSVAIPFVVAAGIGALAGGRLSSRVDAVRLTRWFVILLFSVAAYTAIRSGVALATA
jgi:uncharacterized membrane protein YfcA